MKRTTHGSTRILAGADQAGAGLDPGGNLSGNQIGCGHQFPPDPRAGTVATTRMGGGAPPILTEIAGKRGWLTLRHGVESKEIVGIYRTSWSLLDPLDPTSTLATDERPLIEANPDLTRPLEDLIYVRDVVFTTGFADAGE